MSDTLMDKLLDVVEANEFAPSPDEEFCGRRIGVPSVSGFEVAICGAGENALGHLRLSSVSARQCSG
jgi:hypothetical protein